MNASNQPSNQAQRNPQVSESVAMAIAGLAEREASGPSEHGEGMECRYWGLRVLACLLKLHDRSFVGVQGSQRKALQRAELALRLSFGRAASDLVAHSNLENKTILWLQSRTIQRLT